MPLWYWKSVLIGLLLTGLSGLSYAEVPIPAPPTVAATGHLLLDHHSGAVLAENNANQRLEPASLTKIMTAYAIFRELKEGNIQLADQVLISAKAWRTEGSRMFIEVGKKATIEQLLKGLIIQSGNDASVALAEHIAGSESTFADLMNSHAKRLGMDNTHFVNSTGLPDPEHYTTPLDIAKVTIATIREFPDYYQWYAEKDYTYNDIRQHNRNKLLWRDNTVDGVKTGHTEAAGYCLVASANREDMRLVSVVMGTRSEDARAKETLSLFNYGFRFFKTYRLYGAGDKLDNLRVWKGALEELPVGLEQDLYVTIPRNKYDEMDARMILEPKILAPVSKGQSVGYVSIRLGEEEVTRTPLSALRDVPKGNLWQQLKDAALLWFE